MEKPEPLISGVDVTKIAIANCTNVDILCVLTAYNTMYISGAKALHSFS